MHDEYGVVRLVVEKRRQCSVKTFGIRIPDDIDGVGVRPGRWQLRVELIARRGGQFRELAAERHEPVDREHGDTAAVGENREALAGEGFDARQRFGRIEQLVDVVDPQKTGAAKGGIVNRIRPGEGAGVGRGGLGGGRRASRFHDDDGFDARRGTGRRHEGLRVLHRLDIEEDRARGGIERVIVQHVAEIDVGHVADGDEAGEADLASRRPGDERGGDGARLRHDREIARRHGLRREAGVEVGLG